MTDPGAPTDPEGPGDVLGSLPRARPQRRSPKRDRTTRASRSQRPARPAAGVDAGTRAGSASRTAKQRRTRADARGTGAADRTNSPAGSVAAQGYHAVTDTTPVEPPSSREILVSAVQAAGEVAQIGLTIGERLLRAATSRLPKP